MSVFVYLYILYIHPSLLYVTQKAFGGRRDRMVIRFTTTSEISVYHH